MIKCQRCNGQAKLYHISAKCADLYSHEHLNKDTQYKGYVPDWIGRWGDYVEFTICRHCGQVQGEWPMDNPEMNQFGSGRVI
jgi:hypothetical protein